MNSNLCGNPLTVFDVDGVIFVNNHCSTVKLKQVEQLSRWNSSFNYFDY